MAIQLQIRRGTTAENDLFTGAVGELTMDTDTKGMRIHDGSTQGGVQVPTADTADYVVEWQRPTDLNGYTWYRKYKSGWVEQGGSDFTTRTINAGTGTTWSVTMPVPMSDTNYNIQISFDNGNLAPAVNNNKQTTTTQVYLGCKNQSTSNVTSQVQYWQVCGMAA